MAIESELLQVNLIVQEDTGATEHMGWPVRAEDEIRRAVLAAVAVLLRDRPNVQVEWSGCLFVPLDGKPWFGRCVVCNRWVYDCESPSGLGQAGVSKGAKVGGQFRCDEHLTPGHPLCFAGRGYDGPIPNSQPNA
jgi:hypothetical protein